jgi:acyl-CoA thioester hydrolase
MRGAPLHCNNARADSPARRWSKTEMVQPDAAGEPALPTRRGEFRVLRLITTRWMDNDQYGHVNNVVYYSYFDTAVNGYLIEASGCDVRQLPAIGIVAETSCRFVSELSFPDTVHAGLALEKLGNSSVIYRIGLFRNQEIEPAALGRFVHVYVDAATRRPVPVPPQVRAALETLRLGYAGFGELP